VIGTIFDIEKRTFVNQILLRGQRVSGESVMAGEEGKMFTEPLPSGDFA